MKFISLGRHCDVAYNINKYIGKDETFFFDWARTDFKGILNILNVTRIENILNKENVNVDFTTYSHENDTTLTFEHLDKQNITVLFHHEMKITDFNDDTFNDFIDKYARRHKRLIELIKSDAKIIFIHKVGDGASGLEMLFDEFIQTILLINKNANCCLVILCNKCNVEPNSCEVTSTESVTDKKESDCVIEKKPYFLKINYNSLIDKDIQPDWIGPELNWLELFNIITNNVEQPTIR